MVCAVTDDFTADIPCNPRVGLKSSKNSSGCVAKDFVVDFFYLGGEFRVRLSFLLLSLGRSPAKHRLQ